VVVEVLMIVGVVLLPLPALALGVRGLFRRTGRASIDDRADRLEFALVVTGRLIGLLLLFALSGITLLSCIGGLIKDLRVPSLVYVFFVADLLVATLVVLTFGRRVRRPARRPASPAQP
jgi:biotin transporter BioY